MAGAGERASIRSAPDARCARALLLAAGRLRVPRRARRHPGARRGRRGDRPGAARGQRQPRRGLRDQPARQGDPRGGRGQGRRLPRLRPARGDLRREHDLAELHALAHRRARASQPATRSSSPRSTTTAASRRGSSSPHDRDLVVRHVELHDDTTLDFDDLERKLGAAHAGGGVRLGVQRRRHDRRRPPGLRAGPRGRRAGLGRRRPLRRPRADRRARDRRRRADLLAVQVLRAAPGDGLRPAPRCSRPGGRTRRARRRPRRSGRRFETGTLPYELLAGFNATIDYLDSIGGFDGDRPLRARARRAVPGRRSPTR